MIGCFFLIIFFLFFHEQLLLENAAAFRLRHGRRSGAAAALDELLAGVSVDGGKKKAKGSDENEKASYQVGVITLASVNHSLFLPFFLSSFLTLPGRCNHASALFCQSFTCLCYHTLTLSVFFSDLTLPCLSRRSWCCVASPTPPPLTVARVPPPPRPPPLRTWARLLHSVRCCRRLMALRALT
jgi:hypothetical protein